jgi:transcription termination factor NusA
MTESIAFRLAEQGIRTQEELAESAVDELDGIEELSAAQ